MMVSNDRKNHQTIRNNNVQTTTSTSTTKTLIALFINKMVVSSFVMFLWSNHHHYPSYYATIITKSTKFSTVHAFQTVFRSCSTLSSQRLSFTTTTTATQSSLSSSSFQRLHSYNTQTKQKGFVWNACYSSSSFSCKTVLSNSASSTVTDDDTTTDTIPNEVNGSGSGGADGADGVVNGIQKGDSSSSVKDNVDVDDESTRLPTNDDDNGRLLKIRHSTSHVMAMAVQRLYPEAQVTIGPGIENGFYYDFYFPPVQAATTAPSDNSNNSDDKETTTKQDSEVLVSRKLNDNDLKAIKKEMDKIISKDLPITRIEVTREEARRKIEELNEPFKLEILDSIQTEPITLYTIGTKKESTNDDDDNDTQSTKEEKDSYFWWDLCAGPHVERTGQLPKKAIELMNVAGSYWRGDETREQLQRIYGTAWNNPNELKLYKKQLEEAKKRDHRVLGKKLNLFSIQQDDAGGGLVFWHPNGSKVRNCIENFWKETHIANGYELIYTPHIANLNLWKTSGHYDYYRTDMFDQMSVDENQLYQLKPMNCPFHCLIYKNELRSYKDLPYRWAELGTVYRYERSGTLHGLMRVRGFTQDDAHIFCLPEQLEDEIGSVLNLTELILSRFGFNKYDIMLSTRPTDSVGTDEIWDAATNALENALRTKGWKYNVDVGGGAFYGPKIDIKVRDAIGRQWQCSTIQCDFNLPERFQLEYISAQNTKERPIMVHRAIFGSMERFFGILIENTSGNFPLWLAPTQLILLPVTDSAVDYCKDIVKQAKIINRNNNSVRIEIDTSKERLAKQIRNAEQQRIPLIGVIGQKEIDNGTITIRSRQLGDLGSFSIQTVVEEIQRCNNDAIEFTLVGTKEEKENSINNNNNNVENVDSDTSDEKTVVVD